MSTDVITIAGQQYSKAAWSRRIVAQIIDLALVLFACAMVGKSFVLSLIMIALSTAYFLIGSGLMKGATVGKRFVGVKVLETRHGGPCSVVQEFLRHRYLLFANPVFMLFMAYDSAKGSLEPLETCVVQDMLIKVEEGKVPESKPARLDLNGMRDVVQKIRFAHDDAGPH
ncbi:MAG: RDD family protein [Verrucomicrobia bacterium]|nr:RDD family protein [Verrucomicrobiota bacterium]